jgi:hypothetical protein
MSRADWFCDGRCVVWLSPGFSKFEVQLTASGQSFIFRSEFDQAEAKRGAEI